MKTDHLFCSSTVKRWNSTRGSHSSTHPTRPHPRFERGQALCWSVVAGFWLIFLACAWWLAGRRTEPRLAATRMVLKQARAMVAAQHQRIRALQRARTRYALADQVSRQANNEIETTLVRARSTHRLLARRCGVLRTSCRIDRTSAELACSFAGV